jgi:Phospholipase_D-nuclease N-terminal
MLLEKLIERVGHSQSTCAQVRFNLKEIRPMLYYEEKLFMSGNRGCIFNSILFLVIVFVPVLGHIIATIMVFEDDHSLAGAALWLAVIWLIPFLGSFLYLLFGQRRRRVMFGQPSYGYNQYQTQPGQYQKIY